MEVKQQMNMGPVAKVDVYVLDKGLMHTSNFPNVDDTGMVKQARFYFAQYNLTPAADFFSCVKEDDEKRLTFGPIAVRGNMLDTTIKTKAVAIHQFLKSQLRYPYDELTKTASQRHEPGILGPRHTYYIVSDCLDHPDHLRQTRIDFHRHDPKLYLSQFTAISYRSKPDLAVCWHKVPETEKDQLNYAIHEHVVKCLDRKEGVAGVDMPAEENYYNICEQWDLKCYSEGQPVPRDKIPPEYWRKMHPHWRYFQYRSGDGFIPITEDEMLLLPQKLRDLYIKLERGTATSRDQSEARQDIGKELFRMFSDYKAYNWDIHGFSHVKDWTIFELLKCLVFPPPPRATKDDYGPKFTLKHQQLGMIIRMNMEMVSNAPPMTDEEKRAREDAKAGKSATAAAARGGGRGKRGSSLSVRGAAKTTSSGRGRGKGKSSQSAAATGVGVRKAGMATLLRLRYCEETKQFMDKAVQTTVMSPNKKYYIVIGDYIQPFLNHICEKLHVPVESLLESHEPIGIGEEAFADMLPRMQWQFGGGPPVHSDSGNSMDKG